MLKLRIFPPVSGGTSPPAFTQSIFMSGIAQSFSEVCKPSSYFPAELPHWQINRYRVKDRRKGWRSLAIVIDEVHGCADSSSQFLYLALSSDSSRSRCLFRF